MSSRRFQVAAASLLLAAFATAQSRLSPAEAMALCFPDSVVTTDPTMLQRTERDQIAKASGEKAPGPMVYRYRAHKGKNLVAVGYVDSHRVRSKKQVLLVIIDALTPTQPAARAIVAGGLILTVLWSAQAVLGLSAT